MNATYCNGSPTQLQHASKLLYGTAPLDQAPSPPKNVTTLAQLFQHQARIHPDEVAFSCYTDNGLKSITYAEADLIANTIGLQLVRQRSQADRAPVIAVWLEKGLDLVLAILATTYSGATWLPFDPDVPLDRATTCVTDAAATIIICDQAHEARAREVRRRVAQSSNNSNSPSLEVTTFDGLCKPSTKRSWASTLHAARPDDACYLIYTSGTTGTPKGIAISQAAALTFVFSERAVLETCANDVVWNGFSPAFDMFVEEMWITVCGSGHLAIGTREECQDVPGLPALWAERGVTIVNAVPTLIGIMGVVQGDDNSSLLPPSIRLINLGGEACPPALVNRLARPGLRIINTYGPTETTVTATWDELQPDVPVTIGRPLPSYHAGLLAIHDDESTTIELLDLAADVEGELAIGGPCVGIGYVGRADLTAQKFLPHPLFPGERLYRTGDRVRLQADGKIVFRGRIDTQVKHRGFRIELGEIETLLSSHPDVQAAAVILANADTEHARLEGFVVVRPGAVQDSASIMASASQRLPAYMRPEVIIFLNAEEMPRLPSGKINAKALHDVSARKMEEATAQEKAAAADRSDSGYESGQANDDPILGLLLSALSQSFPQVAHIGPDSDFFDDLGGHSLIAAILVSRLRQVSYGPTKPFASIGLPDIYEGRTPEGIAARFRATTYLETSSLDDAPIPKDGTGPQTGDFLPVSRSKFFLCGLAQLPVILFLFFVHSIEFLVPYLLFDYLISEAGVGWAVLATYSVFVAIPPCLTLTALIGKWIVLGKAKEGEYPLYGVYYFRWWCAERLMALANPKLIANSPLYSMFLKAAGAQVGSYCHLGSLRIGAAADLVKIGNDVIIGGDVRIGVSVVERGLLILKSVTISDDAIIGSNCVIEGGAFIGEASEIGPLSMVPTGQHVPDYERYHGSPARFERAVIASEAALGRRSRPSNLRHVLMILAQMAVAGLMLPLLYFVPQIPGLLLFDLVDLGNVSDWAQPAILSIPIAFAYQILVFTQLLLFRHIFLGRMREGKRKIYSAWYLRFWFIERLMDLALTVLHPVFASLYIVPFLRALGVKIGRRAEVSTARGLSFELLEIGEESFVADSVLMGDHQLRGNEITFRKTRLEKRAFAGNASLLPSGTVLASGTLVGVLSIPPPPERPLAPGVSCFGSPAVLMPARQRVQGHDDAVLFNPSIGRIAARLVIEGLRIIMPRAILIFGLGFSLQIAYLGYSSIGAVYTLLLLPAFYFFLFALPSLLLVMLLKWTLIGRYRDSEWPLWSLNVWLSEAVTSTWETVTMPLLASLLVGTPYLAVCFRLMGVKIGSRVTLLHSDITEYDCVSIGDEATINEACGAQTHLFEDRIMKIGHISIGERATLKPYSVCLPGSTICDGAQLGSLSLLMKGETLPEGTAWEGAPVRPRAVRAYSTARASSLAESEKSRDSGSSPSARSMTETKSIDSRSTP